MAKKKTDDQFEMIDVRLSFTGTVSIRVPCSVPEERRSYLAGVYALAKALATMDNPDAPDEHAITDYANEFDLTETRAEKDYDRLTDANGICGDWTIDE
jgi:hypothetical protein